MKFLVHEVFTKKKLCKNGPQTGVEHAFHTGSLSFSYICLFEEKMSSASQNASMNHMEISLGFV